MAKEQTLQEIIQNLRIWAEKLSEYIQNEKDNTNLFMLLSYPDEEGTDAILSALLGNYKESIKTLVATMDENPEIAKFILHSVAMFMSMNNSIEGRVIKVRADSDLGRTIRDMIEEQMYCSDPNCPRCNAKREQRKNYN